MIATSLRLAQSPKTLALALSFSPRPSAFFRPETSTPTLFSDPQKLRALSELGVQQVILQSFDQEFSQLSPDDFYEIVLRRQFNAKFITVGQDFCFGRGRTGHAQWLQARAAKDNLIVNIGEDVFHGANRISSTQIRDSLSKIGDVDLATMLLGRPYMLEGVIETGDQIGRTWGFPTANLGQLHQLVPLDGVYAGWVWLGDADPTSSKVPPVMSLPKDKIPAVFAIGTRPSLKLPQPTLRIEAHLLSGHYSHDGLYGRRAGYYLAHHIRQNMKFDNLECLKLQIKADADQARRLLS